MRLIFLLFVSLFFIGCGFVPKKPLTVHRFMMINVGMSESEVLETMNDVDVRLKGKDGTTMYVYEDRAVSASSDNTRDYFFLFDKDGILKSKEMGPITSGGSRDNSGANAAAAFGQAIQNSVPKTTNCTSRKDAFGNVQTQCSGY